ncbi:hypothetical protein CLAFUW4_07666 [Fulvia fulva]|uniref:Cupin type-2 domain-containing protein n=1 Tax=Passalora fulva TaxID=5499 RepID=A0A9Q8LCD2_PASFU|nr:uncharacterized protein CLAFUR5_07795 [Fulvia fulva]KAK4629707.1 hypothetical protein CLAFUR4_07671 [Fulvia fulva]KAK4630826.1 hypothetical protein CLAFUR0_07671 [Fulvia fulva]UJO14770.1 hypothetical protein CLAFUR5_07795 [Fulvia fulva]WPV12855.1 hypothetical protein CLAFUW4_07666 [Fulvia fulva]WPV27611.1 hypothetical protein CLAFUW7_07667 [Fulvia fulva]
MSSSAKPTYGGYNKNAPLPGLEILYKHKLQNTPGKSILGLRVDFPPGGDTPPHSHHGASVSVVVLAGKVFNKMNDEPIEIFETNGSFYESPTCKHKVSANVSDSEPATILATMIMETEKLEKLLENGPFGLVDVEEEYR